MSVRHDVIESISITYANKIETDSIRFCLECASSLMFTVHFFRGYVSSSTGHIADTEKSCESVNVIPNNNNQDITQPYSFKSKHYQND